MNAVSIESIEDLADTITANEAALTLHVSLRQVYRWMEEGKLPAVKVVGRLRVRRADVLALVRPVEPRRKVAKEEAGPARSREERRQQERWRADVRARSRI